MDLSIYTKGMNIVEKIAKNVEKRRKGMKISVEKLSKKADVSLSALNKIRSLKSSFVRVETLFALSKALGCSMDDLVK